MHMAIEKLKIINEKQKSVVKGTIALVLLTSFHMLLDPILHWSSN